MGLHSGFFLLIDDSSIGALVDVDGSTFSTAKMFVTFSSGTLVFAQQQLVKLNEDYHER
jgi:hypothetical protein